MYGAAAYRLDPATHIGPLSYISPTAKLDDGSSYLDRTTETAVGIIREECRKARRTTG